MSYVNFAKVKIYDCFTFFNEFDLLKFRLEYLYEHVEKFVISEANVTFSGVKKNFNFLDNKKEFARWMNKIEYIQYKPSIENFNFDRLPNYDPNYDAWKVEQGQRDILCQPLVNLDDNSLIIVTDLDEIWNPTTIRNLEPQEFNAARLEMNFYYYYMNCKGVGDTNKTWIFPFCITPSFMETEKNEGFHKFRNEKGMHAIANAGWHFSYLGGAQSIIKKIESFSHQEYNTKEITNVSRIEKYAELGLDPFDRSDHKWEFISTDAFPAELLALMEKYPKFLKVTP